MSFPSELHEKIVAEYPQKHFKEGFIQEYFAGFGYKPGTTYGTVNSSICDVIRCIPLPRFRLIQRVPRSEEIAEMSNGIHGLTSRAGRKKQAIREETDRAGRVFN